MQVVNRSQMIRIKSQNSVNPNRFTKKGEIKYIPFQSIKLKCQYLGRGRWYMLGVVQNKEDK